MPGTIINEIDAVPEQAVAWRDQIDKYKPNICNFQAGVIRDVYIATKVGRLMRIIAHIHLQLW